MHEWPLLIFTVALPAAVGGILFLWFAHGSLKKTTTDVSRLMKWPLVITALVAIVGLIGSFFHLGSPMSAINTVKGFGRSWMSNEIVFTGLFLALICITAGLALVYKKVKPVLMIVTGLVGLIAIYSMATTYAVTRINGWDHLNTYIVFFGTAFALGPVLGASLLVPGMEKEKRKDIIKRAFMISIFGIAIQVIGAAMFSAYTSEIQLITGGTAAEKLAPYSGMAGIRWVVELLGLGVLGYMALGTKQKLSYAFVYAALLVFVIAEGMSRYLFYVIGS
ncbi:dimethyl sulfoxide reductase anchor subunit family protein [Bacillus marinisedimentorum]|uniref:dimethyl sulfoxide reductase anchor subunit family protein n=1 Tax=Bacillus marinisedimentorum TaxID=1821260 RepID=UPI000872644B|nr:DmsC/YnfH family molybdoenzyme membrane anchor subunit [Bacillus marinisedimentorum]